MPAPRARRTTPLPAPRVHLDADGRWAAVEDVRFLLARPDSTERSWIGQERDPEAAPGLLARRRRARPAAHPAHHRHARHRQDDARHGRGPEFASSELYIYQCTADTRPEDLLVTPVLAESGKIVYHASPLVTAMIRGGVCILDEGNRMNEKSWACLAPLLDHRRYVEIDRRRHHDAGPRELPLPASR